MRYSDHSSSQHERSDPANKDLTALGGSSGLGGDHSKSTTQGPHSSSMMNKIDPRVDSDQSRNTRTSDQTGNYVDPASGTTDLNQRFVPRILHNYELS